mmetsp:Transcript_8835/g.13110  ORF Transcript_8835/g.13110 Transcript_8835/m.13110 type:complete len:413 (+) Transcript_8835:31-1269(+)
MSSTTNTTKQPKDQRSETTITNLIKELTNQKILIYGAYGYTGELVCEILQKLKVDKKHFVIGGRSTDKLEKLKSKHGLNFDTVTFSLDGKEKEIDDIFKKHQFNAVLNCAGPFQYTARPMIKACIRNGSHYLDITGEFNIFEYVHANPKLSEKAAKASIALIPGVGFDVVPSDCLAKHVADAYQQKYGETAHQLDLAFIGKGKPVMSHGTKKTMFEGFTSGASPTRLNGKIVSVPYASFIKEIPFEPNNMTKKTRSMSIPWGDISTAYHTTNIPNVQVYLGGVAPGAFATWLMRNWFFKTFLSILFSVPGVVSLGKKMIEWGTQRGPNEDERHGTTQYLYGEATNKDNTKKVVRQLEVAEGYHLTSESALTATLLCALAKQQGSGSLTPSQAFGKDYILSFSKSNLHVPSKL